MVISNYDGVCVLDSMPLNLLGSRLSAHLLVLISYTTIVLAWSERMWLGFIWFLMWTMPSSSTKRYHLLDSHYTMLDLVYEHIKGLCWVCGCFSHGIASGGGDSFLHVACCDLIQREEVFSKKENFLKEEDLFEKEEDYFVMVTLWNLYFVMTHKIICRTK